jgi:alpha-glucosidase
MYKYRLLPWLLLSPIVLLAQQKTSIDPKVFWSEDFKAGVLPEGWKTVDLSKEGCDWLVTNQPYPGSFEYQQQAPPIASRSRGYHLQYQAGYFVDEDQPSWEKKGHYPDAYVQTAAIDCRGRQSVILKFQETFRWNSYKTAAESGLFVGVSTDSLHWTDINVMNGVAGSTDMFTPMNEELNITKLAAGQPRVFLRWYWKGIFSWYWMVDDIALSEAYDYDVSITRLTSHTEEGNVFRKSDTVAVRIRNGGAKPVTTDFDVTCLVDGKLELQQILHASQQALAPGEERDVVFPGVDLSRSPTHSLLFTTGLSNDERKDNNILGIKINAQATPLGNITSFTSSGNEVDIASGISKIKIIFYGDDIFRVWLAPDGAFVNPADSEIVVQYPAGNVRVGTTDAGNYYKLQSKACVVRVYKTPIRLAMYDVTNTRLIWEESKPLVFGARTVQSMERRKDEYFYGCGMQNGYFSHRDKEVLIEKGGGWDDGGRANPAPFYMSTAGYGVLRNTFDAGKYAFREQLTFSHNENRFDAIYFYGPSLKKILDDYTLVTGRPFLMPRWALSMGDANCYNKPDRNKQPQTTPAVIATVADKYIANDMPRGWILPNDGYGCGYTKLDSVVKELSARGFRTGLWTENGVARIATEVGQYGTRLCKLDVAWVGPGYKYALDACRSAYEGIENNCTGRGFVWSVMGWAGTQRYSTVWSGDQKGNWEYIRFHIPTVIGSGLSGFNAATGDVDGIFGGSDSTYVRDLQWKCFTPVLMVMSGWAKKDKQPYIYGEPFSSINRKYLKLKMRLTPYMYTYCHEAYETGVPTSRAMVLEYPRDRVTWGKSTQYQFMNGEWLLVAPVYKSEGKRDSIYLPKGTWYDYWTGDAYAGGRWLNNFAAPLEKLPLLVKEGAIIPMYPQMYYDGERPADTLTLDIYPAGSSAFDLYEDDGLTRDYRKGAFAKTLISVKAGEPARKAFSGSGAKGAGQSGTAGGAASAGAKGAGARANVLVTIGAARGNYAGRYDKRVYLLDVHTAAASAPLRVLVSGKAILKCASPDEFDKAGSGYYYDPNDRKGVVHVKTAYLGVSTPQTVQLYY